MDPSSSLPRSQQRLQTHDHQEFSYQSIQATYYYQQIQRQQHYVHNPPPGHAYHQVPPSVVPVTDAPQMADSVERMAHGVPNPLAAGAVVSMWQLTQFEGTTTTVMPANFGAAPLHLGPTLVPLPPAGGSPYDSSGRRGRGSLRGSGSRYNMEVRLPRTGDHATGCEGGGGGPECFQQHGASSPSEQDSSTGNVKSTDEAEPLAVSRKETTQTAVQPVISAAEKASFKRRPWCEVCNVELPSLTGSLLDIHKNGRRHKKNLQKAEESKNAANPGIEKQKGEKPAAKPENKGSQQPNSGQEGEEKMPIENLLAESLGDEYSIELKQQIEGEKYTEATVEETPRSDCSESQRRGIKRKMEGGQGWKCMETSEASGLKDGPCKGKVLIPLICDLCNVKCTTQDLFNSHLSGKKHTAKLKRFRPMGLYVVYPPNPIAQTMLLPQGNQPVHSLQGSDSAAEAYMPPQIGQAAATTSGLNLQYQQNTNQIAPESAVKVAHEAYSI